MADMESAYGNDGKQTYQGGSRADSTTNSPLDPVVPDDPMPMVDRFDPHSVDHRREDMSYNFEEHQGFEPATLEYEKLTGGWLRTTMPEGVPRSELHELYYGGSRGAEVRLRKPTVGRTTLKGRRGFLDSRSTYAGGAIQGGDWDSGGDGISDGSDDGT